MNDKQSCHSYLTHTAEKFVILSFNIRYSAEINLENLSKLKSILFLLWHFNYNLISFVCYGARASAYNKHIDNDF